MGSHVLEINIAVLTNPDFISIRRNKMSNLETSTRFADLLKSGDLKELQALMADDFRAKGATRELTKQQALGYLQMFFAAFPDHRFNFVDFNKEEEDLITCTGQETGTHLGVLDLKPFGIPVFLPPTGKSFKLSKSIYTFRVASDKVTCYSEEAVKGGGLAGILEQLGVKLS
jgi:predicted ester cyclase